MFCKIQVKILVNGEERISPWANYVLQPPRENQVILHIFCVRVICTIFKGFEGTAFAQHMWTPPADVKHKLSHTRPSKPSSLRWPELDSFGISYEIPKYWQNDFYPGFTSAMWVFQVRRVKSTPTRTALIQSFPE